MNQRVKDTIDVVVFVIGWIFVLWMIVKAVSWIIG